jgi:Flp pilus assembly protein TadG
MSLQECDVRIYGNRFLQKLKNWLQDTEAVAAVEAALIMPVLAVLFLGAFDVGRGILINQKVVSASQIAADLIARGMSVDINDVNEAIEASQLALQPYDTSTFGIDIVSLEFDANDQPQILWRETRNMTPNNDSVASTAGVFPEGEGVIIVTVAYTYEPSFGDTVIGDVTMREIAFARGRRSATVTMN